MKGTQSKQADTLARGLFDYYSTLENPTAEQTAALEKITVNSGIVCPDIYDGQILAFQNMWVSGTELSALDPSITEILNA